MTLTATQRRLLDEFAEVRARNRAWKPDVNPHLPRLNELKAEILSWYEDEPAEERFIATGDVYQLPITPCERKRTLIDLPAFYRKVKRDKFLQLCTVTLAAVEKALDKADIPKFIKEERTGPRDIGEPSLIEAA